MKGNKKSKSLMVEVLMLLLLFLNIYGVTLVLSRVKGI